nr:DUF1295 domain-containing protein [Ancylobacter lacus]
MMLAWALAVRSRNHGWVDTVWSFAVGLAGAGAALVPAGPHGTSGRQWLVAGLAALWSLRLGSHILRRSLNGKDDPRYAELLRAWGRQARLRLFIFLQIQAVAGLLLVLAVLVAARNPLPFGRPGDWLGGAMLALAILGAGLADRQLARFRADPANRRKVCDVGLWGLSRHPNYFFEWLGWLALAVIAIDLGGVYPLGYAALIGPALMYVLLVHASGIPPTEAHMLRSRGEAFRAYQRRVNAFWPGLPPSKPGRS